jgi:hypothetical protein
MAVMIAPEAQALIDRLAAVNRVSPVIDRERAERALAIHFERLGMTPLPVRWAADTEDGLTTTWSAAESAAWSAAESAARSAARSAAIDRWIGIWLPFVDAFEAGLWLFWVTTDEVVAVPRPALQIEGERLHCADGPAVAWPTGARFYFWHGVEVPRAIIEHPEAITVPKIDGEVNAEIRRVMVERYGLERFLKDGGAVVVHRDATGVLYQRDLGDDEPLVMVGVKNSTPEPDGSVKDYFLRVHPELRPLLPNGELGEPQQRTARNAVASTFGRRGEQYHPDMET